MRELIEQLNELFGFGKDTHRQPGGKLSKPNTKFGRAVAKKTAQHAVKNAKKSPYLAKHGGQHLAARSRLARMKKLKRKPQVH